MDLLEYEFLCKLSDLPPGGRRCMLLPSTQRSVMLLRLRDEVYCMDQACYHHGGPLLNGEIEELGGKVTIKCPWHAYHIAVETGEGLYKGVDMTIGPTGKPMPSSPKIKSKGVKQRTHFVEIRNGEDVYVADSSRIPGSALLESDTYAFKRLVLLSPSVSPAPSPTNASTGTVRIHSRFF